MSLSHIPGCTAVGVTANARAYAVWRVSSGAAHNVIVRFSGVNKGAFSVLEKSMRLAQERHEALRCLEVVMARGQAYYLVLDQRSPVPGARPGSDYRLGTGLLWSLTYDSAAQEVLMEFDHLIIDGIGLALLLDEISSSIGTNPGVENLSGLPGLRDGSQISSLPSRKPRADLRADLTGVPSSRRGSPSLASDTTGWLHRDLTASGALINRASQRHRCTSTALLTALVAQVYMSFLSLDELVFAVPLNGRWPAVRNAVGNFSTLAPVSLRSCERPNALLLRDFGRRLIELSYNVATLASEGGVWTLDRDVMSEGLFVAVNSNPVVTLQGRQFSAVPEDLSNESAFFTASTFITLSPSGAWLDILYRKRRLDQAAVSTIAEEIDGSVQKLDSDLY